MVEWKNIQTRLVSYLVTVEHNIHYHHLEHLIRRKILLQTERRGHIKQTNTVQKTLHVCQTKLEAMELQDMSEHAQVRKNYEITEGLTQPRRSTRQVRPSQQLHRRAVTDS